MLALSVTIKMARDLSLGIIENQCLTRGSELFSVFSMFLKFVYCYCLSVFFVNKSYIVPDEDPLCRNV